MKSLKLIAPVALAQVLILLAACDGEEKKPAPAAQATPAGTPATAPWVPDGKNTTYTIGGRPITLQQGYAEQAAAPGAATKILTRLTDTQATADVNGDGKIDLAVVLVQQPGGTGTFYYLVAVLNDGTATGKATNLLLLGDRITVQKLSVDDGRITVEYLTRRPTEPFAATPSVQMVKKFALEDSTLVPQKP